MSIKQISVSVVHLVWLPFGIDLFNRFVQSYKKYQSGYEHELVFLFNGVQEENDTKPYHELANREGLHYKSFSRQRGWDLESYKWAASQLNTEYILFLNSYSEFMNNNWLMHFMKAIQLPGVGIVGATASYHSIFSMIRYETKLSWEWGKTLNENFRKYKLLIKNLFLYRTWFSPFPNPHIRTTGFLIRRDLFSEIFLGKIRKKYDAYRWESGRNGFTRQIMKGGLKPVVIDKEGRTYETKNWEESNTFWIDAQDNLLISDNQTRKFMEADEQQKKFFTLMAWGHE